MAGTITKPDSGTPWRWMETGPLASLRSEMDGLFENFFGNPMSATAGGVSIPNMDVSETDEAIEVKTDLPGIRPEDVNIEIRNDLLTITATTCSEERDESDRKYHRVERHTGQFSRAVRLPCEVSQDDVDAELKDGVLTVIMPRAEDARTRKIPVKG